MDTADVQAYDANAPTAVQDNRSGFKGSRTQKAIESGGKSLSKSGSQMIESSREQAAANMDRQMNIPSYKRGGIVKRTGLARVHKGEKVIPREKVQKQKRKGKRKKSRGM